MTKGRSIGQRQRAKTSGTRPTEINVLVGHLITNIKTHCAVQTRHTKLNL
jgi:hypothetical protein